MHNDPEQGEQGTLFDVSVTSAPAEKEDTSQLVEDVAVAEDIAHTTNYLLGVSRHDIEVKAIVEEAVANEDIAPEEADGIAAQMAYDAVKETP